MAVQVRHLHDDAVADGPYTADRLEGVTALLGRDEQVGPAALGVAFTRGLQGA
ncbi:hypothetical protein [Streptomyces sp. NPDC005476]|uniref:hypothetical protein n=1 Tax=Streptomyces sp. NPDC005476 TaxID=3156882 RepID=UPI003456503C